MPDADLATPTFSQILVYDQRIIVPESSGDVDTRIDVMPEDLRSSLASGWPDLI